MNDQAPIAGALQVTPLKHPQGCRGYLIVDPASKDAMVIDGHLDQAFAISTLVASDGLRLRWVVDTHTHADHPSASAVIGKQLGATRVAHAKSKHVGVTHLPDDHEPLLLGDAEMIVRHAPGHTPDHMAIVGAGQVFSGDSLFIDSVARADFIGGDAGQLYDSIQNVVLTLPDDTVLYPGHDYQDRVESTIGHERANNPWLQLSDRDAFVKAISANKPEEPANMGVLLRYNIDGNEVPPVVSASETVHLVQQGAAGSIIDVRTLEEVVGAHIPGSRHILLDEVVIRADEVRATPAPRLILCHHGIRAQMARDALAGVGIGAMSVIEGGIASYAQAGGEVKGGDLESASGGGGCCAAAPPSSCAAEPPPAP